jgi:hypothetical protein
MNRRLLSVLVCLLIASSAFASARITIQNNDGPNEGFNDATPAEPVGGNPATTIGQQRLNVFTRAAEIWGALIDSPVEIVIASTFDDLSCTATTATLGSAGATEAYSDFESAPRSGILYPVALANKFAGRDLSPGSADIRARFNSKLGQPGCFDSGGGGWYLGFDGNHGTKSDLLVVILHEFGHGLGFASFSNVRTGALNNGVANVFETFILDKGSGLHWDQMTNAQRVSAAINDQNLVWDGPITREAGERFLGAPPVLRVNTPESKTLSAGSATFGSKMTVAGVSATVAAADDVAEPAEGETAAGTTRDGCSPYLNASALVGRIALVDRGRCLFVTKAQNAQAAGAVGLIIVDNRSAATPPGMAGTDRSLTIPVISVTQLDGDAIRAQLASGVNATIAGDASQPLAGTTAEGFLKLYAPGEINPGSSVSHWDVTTQPNTLMEPFISDDLSPLSVDITLEQLLDIGWTATPKTPSGRRVLRRGRN